MPAARHQVETLYSPQLEALHDEAPRLQANVWLVIGGVSSKAMGSSRGFGLALRTGRPLVRRRTRRTVA